VLTDASGCSLQFDPVGKRRFDSSCDVAKSALAKAGVPYSTESAAAGSVAVVRIGPEGEEAVRMRAFDGRDLSHDRFSSEYAAFGRRLQHALTEAGYPAQADPALMNHAMVLALLLLLLTYVTMATGPMAAWLVELFPARVRYTSMSVPYHIGAGWFGGFMPAVAFALVAITGNIYTGLWYPVLVAALTVIAGALLLPETVGKNH
jgi:hypothetical protein